MVRIHPDPPVSEAGTGNKLSAPRRGAVAQLGERLLCKQEAVGSIPSGSTSIRGQASPDRERKVDVSQGRGGEGSDPYGLTAVQSVGCRTGFGSGLGGKSSVESCRSLTIGKARRSLGLDESLADEGLSCILPSITRQKAWSGAGASTP